VISFPLKFSKKLSDTGINMAKKQNKTEDLEPVELSAEDSDQDKKLTPMEEIFCLEYLKHFNARS